jgi:hypothetical protein
VRRSLGHGRDDPVDAGRAERHEVEAVRRQIERGRQGLTA